MTVLSTHARMSAALVACALALAACSRSAAGTATAAPTAAVSQPPATGTATPSPTATYKPASADGPAENVPVPKMPEAAKEKSKEGLKAFAEYWLATMSYAYETGDLELMKSISGPSCTACN